MIRTPHVARPGLVSEFLSLLRRTPAAFAAVSRRPLFEPLEPRLLLSADLGVEVAISTAPSHECAVIAGELHPQPATSDGGVYTEGAQALLATTKGPGGQPALSASAIAAVASAAIERWDASGQIDVAALGDVRFAVVDLPDRGLGLAVGRTILLDRDGAGHGWFIDSSPDDDAEFVAGPVPEILVAMPGGPAQGRIDLLTALGHELGHMGGQDHDGLVVMRASLAPGERVPDFAAEGFAVPEPPPLSKAQHAVTVHYFDLELATLRRGPSAQLNEVAPAFYYERETGSLVAADESASKQNQAKQVQIDWRGGLKSAAKSAAFETLHKLALGPNASIRLR